MVASSLMDVKHSLGMLVRISEALTLSTMTSSEAVKREYSCSLSRSTESSHVHLFKDMNPNNYPTCSSNIVSLAY